MLSKTLPDFTLVLPEIILIISALLILVEGAFKEDKDPSLPQRFGYNTVLALSIALILLILQHKPGERWVTFDGQISQDDFIYFGKILILLGSAAVVTLSLPSMLKENILSFEYSSLILFATVGMLLMIEANDLITLFIGLEMQGLSLYVLSALNRRQVSSSEAALKYFILGAIATSLYLYGASLIYGFSGSTNFDVLASVIRLGNEEALPLGLMISLTFIIAALAFKVSSVPFHMWTPDVYQGCPTAITAFIAATPKIAAMLVFLRLLVLPFSLLYEHWQMIIVFLSFSSMTLGAFAALRQTDIKRLLAYSAIGQIGYALLGIAAGNDEGIQAVFVYLTIYLIMIIGTFGCLLALRGKGSIGVQRLEDLSGLSTLHPKISFILALCMFSLAGIPPLAGFFAKLYVFKAALSSGLFSLAILGVLTSVVAAFYYLKIVKVMYFDAPPEIPSETYGETLALSNGMTIILNLCGLFLLLFFLFPNPLLEMSQKAASVIPI